jgi:hypothetical protein
VITERLDSLRWDYNSPQVEWTVSGSRIRKLYRHPIQCAIQLHDSSGVAIVESREESGDRNAVILDANGEERFRLKVPLSLNERGWFDQMYYVGDRLFAFAHISGVDFRYEVDEHSGTLGPAMESR